MKRFLKRFFEAFRRHRKALKARLPYVRRREFRILRNRHDALIDAFTGGASLASEAGIVVRKAIDPALTGEVCLFVSYARDAAIKPHVRTHIEALSDAGFKVVLVLNADLETHRLDCDAVLLDRLAGCVIRQNTGFDFAGWGHAYVLGNGFANCSRLLLVNDSVIGPLDRSAFDRMIVRLRDAAADIVGLTENAVPHRHLQSYFLAFGPRALACEAFRRAFAGLRSLPTKELVIDAYETALTRQLERAGLVAVALFPPLYHDPLSGDDTMIRWRELIDAGFPYVKASLLASSRHRAAVQAVVPPGLLP